MTSLLVFAAFSRVHIGVGGVELLLLLCFALFLLLVCLRLRGKRSSRDVVMRDPRVASVRENRLAMHEEIHRIVDMVSGGRISPEEGEELLQALSRKTMHKKCLLCGEDMRVEALKCPHCQRFVSPRFVPAARLRKSTQRVVSGVCGGLAEYAGLDASLVRVGFALLTIMSLGVVGIVLYVVLAVVMPEP